MAVMDHRKRALLRGQTNRASPQRPPWSVSDAAFLDNCTRCGACIDACPEHIIRKGDGGFPEVDFKLGECTFCTQCVTACPEPCFLPPDDTQPWAIKATMTDQCLARHGTYCRSCGDSCPSEAISFQLQLGGKAEPCVDHDRCTGCGACVGPCPVDAVRLTSFD